MSAARKEDGSTGGAIRSVKRAFSVLEYLASVPQAGILEIAKETGLHKTTAHAMLATLKELGYVRQPERNGPYHTTLRPLDVGRAILAHRSLPRLWEEYRHEHRWEMAGVLYLTMVSTEDVLVVSEPRESARLETSRKVEWRALVRQTAHAVARLFGPTQSMTGTIEPDTARIARQLGFWVDDDFLSAGGITIAAPVWDITDRVVGAVVCAVPIGGNNQNVNVAEIGEALTECTRFLSAELGFR